MGVGCCIGGSGLEGMWCVSAWGEDHVGGVSFGCLRVWCGCCRVEKVSVGVLVDVRCMLIGGGVVWVGVSVCCSGEGGGSMHGVAVRWLRNACRCTESPVAGDCAGR